MVGMEGQARTRPGLPPRAGLGAPTAGGGVYGVRKAGSRHLQRAVRGREIEDGTEKATH